MHPFNFNRMKKTINFTSILPLLLCLCTAGVFAQTLDYSVAKEKLYIQTNHVFFKPGEQLYFKLYLVKAKDQTPSQVSGTAYVEVINPAGNVLQKLNYKVADGYTEGSYDFDEQAVGGVYKIRAYTNWMRNENDSNYFVKEITVQKLIAPRVLMKLDFPRKGYGAGDEVMADYSIRNLDDQPIRNYETRFTVSIAGQVIQTNTFRTDAQGKAKVTFRLPAHLNSNDGLLNITIHYYSYTEAISRSIPIVLNKIDLQFMPEGGTLVAGIPTNVAFKAVNENGKPADIKGEVWDDSGHKIAVFESYHFGMGKFVFTPQPGKKYAARIISPVNTTQQFSLPQPATNGVVMNISKRNNKVFIRLTASQKTDVKLVGQTKNSTYYQQTVSLSKGEQLIEVNPQLFPAGISQFTLYSAANVPLAERLLFLNEDKVLQVKISADKDKYAPREKVIFHIKTLDENNRPVPANLSLSVIDDKLWSLADDKQDHILSWLLMSSELKGKTEEPQFYFKKDEVKAVPALDLVMLTHGYRYFDYIEYVQQEGKLQFTPDQPNLLSGIVLNDKKLPVPSVVYLVDAAGGDKVVEATTNGDGKFLFHEVVPDKHYYLIARSKRLKEKVTVTILQNSITYIPVPSTLARRFTADGKVIPELMDIRYVKKELPERKDQNMAFFQKQNFPVLRQVQGNLEEVVVTGFGTERKRSVTGSVAWVSARDLMTANNMDAMLNGRVAGLQVTQLANPGSAAQIKIRGVSSLTAATQPLVVMNGIPMDKFDLSMNPNDIESITILKDAAATAVYGCMAANGVIMIESKRGRNEKININLSKSYQYASQHYYAGGTATAVARKFYAPVYTTPETTERNDFRETIYWNPVVQTDNDGNASVEFYNSDATTTFRAIAEGIGYNGKIGRTEFTYAAQSPVSIDAKIPPYLTVGDSALLPLVIKNNRTEALMMTLNLQLPPHVQAGEYNHQIRVEPNQALQILIPVQARAATAGNIRFMVSSRLGKETLSLPFVAVSKGFPVIETFSGNTSAQHSFTISKMVPGSLHSSLKLYNSSEGQLLDGIESMLREPHGCFEQTSSSTYPNIYVLKYLRESGKSNPEIEKKALGYIEAGYKRLMGFETASNGFEWFGKTPPHEALTAYGLLEFTDMQEFINVDKEMLARTKAFLLSRRDGKGGFLQASGGYDRFASVPNRIANTYIVYSLTQAGIGNEIQLEYDTAVRRAIAGNDGYQMAMMALAASNMRNENDFTQLMHLLKANYQKRGLASETSVVNSRDVSLQVEALSLYVLALGREKTPQVGVMAAIISKILAQKSYYGYGSTQGTVLALNAVVTYSKLAGKAAQNMQVQFAVNQQATTPDNTGTDVKEGANIFAVQYSNDKETIPYNMEVAYHTFTPPNSAKAELKLQTSLATTQTKVGETVRMEIAVTNEKAKLQPMAIAKIGIPAGLSVQPWQLKEIMEKNAVAYYEIFDHYLVLYWMGFAAGETKKINLDLKAEIAGTYKGKSGNTYLYYTPEHKHWNDGLEVSVKP